MEWYFPEIRDFPSLPFWGEVVWGRYTLTRSCSIVYHKIQFWNNCGTNTIKWTFLDSKWPPTEGSIIAHNWIYLLQLNPCPDAPWDENIYQTILPYPLLHVVFVHLSCSKSTYSKPSVHQIHGTGNINISLLDSWTPKPWKIKVLSPSNMGYNP